MHSSTLIFTRVIAGTRGDYIRVIWYCYINTLSNRTGTDNGAE